MLFRSFLRYPSWAVFFHILLGVAAQYSPVTVTTYFVLVAILGVVEIWQKRDKGNLTAYYAIYLAGFEIVYRIGKFYLLWELGKYLCIMVLVFGLLFSKRSFKIATPFIVYMLLLMPGIGVALYYGYSDSVYVRKLILQNMSGPICLGIAGVYFFRRQFSQESIIRLLRIGILPSITLVTLLFLGKKISEISFATGSNFETSGGFGPNQVSTMLGWGIILLGFAFFQKVHLTINKITDLALLALLAFRGLLTFSRGGMVGALLGLVLCFGIPLLFNKEGRKKIGRSLIQFSLVGGLFFFTLVFVNQLTNNYLYYRYIGGTPQEIAYASKTDNTGYYLSGRELVAQQEWEAFKDFPFFGTGAGQGTIYRIEKYQFTTSSHLEFTRLIGEHGLFGLFAGLIMLFMPIKHFFKHKNLVTRQWLILFFIISVFTMFHSGMRLAMPAVSFAMAFILIINQQFPQKRFSIKKNINQSPIA